MTDANFAALEKKYLRRRLPPWKNVETLTALFLIVLLPVLCGLLSKLLGDTFFPSTVQNEVYTVRPGDYAWFGPGIILGWGLVGILTNRIYRFYLSKKYHPSANIPQPISDQNIEGHTMLKPILLIAVGLAVAASFFISDNYMIIDRQNVTINELTGVSEKKYRINDIEKISFVKVRKPAQHKPTDSFYTVRFRDGYEFRSRDNMLRFTNEMDRLARFSSRPVDTLWMVR